MERSAGVTRQDRSRSRQRKPPHRGTVATISGGRMASHPRDFMQETSWTREVQVLRTGVNLTPLGRKDPGPTIVFDDCDLKHEVPDRDEPMVISVVAAEYKIERVLVDQGERVPIRGTIKLETNFGERSGMRIISVLYTIVDTPTSYNIIIGRLALNRLGAIISTRHLCMKFPVGRRVGSVWADSHVAQKCYEDSLKVGALPPNTAINALELDLDLMSHK
ncbi:hypothetical protein CR513_26284, partial [Mucuna pruriens]